MLAADRAAFRALLRVCRHADRNPIAQLGVIGRPLWQWDWQRQQVVRRCFGKSPFAEDMIWEACGNSLQFAMPRQNAARACRRHFSRAMSLGLPYQEEAKELMARFTEAADMVNDMLGENAGERLQPLENIGDCSRDLLAGDFLLTHPISCIRDAHFDQAVVFLHEVPSAESLFGTVAGFVVNKPSQQTLAQILAHAPHEEAAWAQEVLQVCAHQDFKVSRGGPVIMGHSLKDNLHVIHGFPNIMDATPLVPGVWLGGQLQELAQAVQASGQKAPLRFIFGQSSWSYTQLQLELSCGVWAMARSQKNAVSLCFGEEQGADAWRAALSAVGLPFMASFPRGRDLDERLSRHVRGKL